MLLDDSLSALDSITEENIMTGLRNDLSQTLVLITHRIEQTKNLDKIFVFHNSKIEAVGTFQELLDSNLYFQNFIKKTTPNLFISPNILASGFENILLHVVHPFQNLISILDKLYFYQHLSTNHHGHFFLIVLLP